MRALSLLLACVGKRPLNEAERALCAVLARGGTLQYKERDKLGAAWYDWHPGLLNIRLFDYECSWRARPSWRTKVVELPVPNAVESVNDFRVSLRYADNAAAQEAVRALRELIDQE